MPSNFRTFLASDIAATLPLLAATAVALVLANSALAPSIEALLETELGYVVGGVGKSL